MEDEMNNQGTKIYNKLTSGAMFDPSRHHTKQAVETVLAKIGVGLEKVDIDALETLEVCAPDGGPLFTTIPRGENPVVYLSPGIETVGNVEAEYWTARAFAEGIATAKGFSKSKITGEVNRILQAWDYPVATARGEAAVSA